MTSLIDTLRQARELIQRGDTVRWRERYAVLDRLDAAIDSTLDLSDKAVQKRLATQRGYVQALTDEQIDDCLPLGMSAHMTLCGPAEIRRFARAVLAAAGAAAQGGEHV